MVYVVEIKPAARKELAALPGDVRRRIAGKIDQLADDPRHNGCMKLVGAESTYRVRTEDYRIVYEVHDDTITVLVIRIAHRREVYR